MESRKYNLSFAELVDRLCLVQMKQNYGGDYKEEMRDVLHDIDSLIKEGKVVVSADMIRAITVMVQANVEIWINEDNERKGIIEESPNWEQKYKNILRTHKLNSTRSEAKARVQELIGGRTDKKLNYHNGEWEIFW